MILNQPVWIRMTQNFVVQSNLLYLHTKKCCLIDCDCGVQRLDDRFSRAARFAVPSRRGDSKLQGNFTSCPLLTARYQYTTSQNRASPCRDEEEALNFTIAFSRVSQTSITTQNPILPFGLDRFSPSRLLTTILRRFPSLTTLSMRFSSLTLLSMRISTQRSFTIVLRRFSSSTILSMKISLLTLSSMIFSPSR